MLRRITFASLVLGICLAAIFTLPGGRPAPRPVLGGSVSYGALQVDVDNSAPGKLVISLEHAYTNPIRDAFYTVAFSVQAVDGPVVWSQVVNRLQGQLKGKPYTITLEPQHVAVHPGLYDIHVEIREDAPEFELDGTLLSPWSLIASTTAEHVTVR